uniref:Endo-1,3-beta-D-glucanase isoform 2 n=1 Tax=Lambis sp. AAB-2014 TaxID=1577140 RepID=A0A0A7EC89_9CAEN|nr:endo-1,3-beta-D-glucanase isoform 2 [Lambis sp. AAB-2014]
MSKALWSLAVCAAVWSSRCAAQSPVWTRAEDGHLHVTVPGIHGAVSVAVTIQSEGGQDKKAFLSQMTADNNWRTVFNSATNSDDLRYVIEYMFPDSSVHRVTGSHKLNRVVETGVALGSERHLRRRATTVLYDEFNSGHINTNWWTHDRMAVGIGGFQIFSPEPANSYVRNGMLFIKPTLTVDHFGNDIMNHGTIDARQLWGDCIPAYGDNTCVTHGHDNRPIMSALLRSSAHIRYGRVEVQARLPIGDWLWPAIWLMPVTKHYGSGARSGEIDIMEAAGNLHLTDQHGQSLGADCDRSTIHYGIERSGPLNRRQSGKYRLQGTNFGRGFHTYWLDWTEAHIRIGVDDHTVLAVNTPQEGFWVDSNLPGTNIWAEGGRNAPFDRPFYLILNVAVGDGFFWDGLIYSPYDRPWTSGASNDFRQFWNARHLWEPTWHGDDVAMRVRSVKMQQY